MSAGEGRVGLRLFLFLLPASLSVAGCVRTSIQDFSVVTPEGAAAPASFNLNGREYPITKCWSGDRGHFLGVDLFGPPEGPGLRIVMDPLEGPRLRLFRGGEAWADVVGPGDCSDLRASVRPTGWRVNHVRDVEGELAAECELPDGGRLEARVSFAHCH